MIYDVCVIGGGASGLAAAIAAARNGASVLVLDRMDKAGKKILATGNGKCNLTNAGIDRRYMDKAAYRSRQSSFPMKVLAGFDAGDTLAFFESLALSTKNKDGYIYPMSEQASAVCDSLKWELAELKADVVTGEEVIQIQKMRNGSGKDRFVVKTHINHYQSSQVILAAGGQSNSALGSNGSGYELCRQMGHRIVPVVPALCALRCREKFFKELAGIRVQGKVQIIIDGCPASADRGEIQLTAYGISGIPVFQVSRYAAYGLYEHRDVRAVLDLMPDMEEYRLYERLSELMADHPGRTMRMILSGFMNKKLAACLTKICHLEGERPCQTVGRQQLSSLVRLIKKMEVHITDTNGFEQSQVTAGGVDTREINAKNLSSKIVPGLFIVGELLDVDGICGGYNLQWAWATGILAGRSVHRGAIKND